MKDDDQVFVPEERRPVEAALRAVTLDAAWQRRMDDICGSPEPRNYADLALPGTSDVRLGAHLDPRRHEFAWICPRFDPMAQR